MSQIFEIDGSAIKHEMTANKLAVWRAQVALARGFVKNKQDALRDAVRSKDCVAVEAAVHALVSDKRSALVSVVRANGRLAPKHRVSLEECKIISSQIDLEKPTSEKVRIRFKPKADGFRTYCVFGIHNRARHDMVVGTMRQIHSPRNWQFGMRGVPPAIKALETRLLDGACHVAHLDIVNYFGSFDANALPGELPLPQKVAEQAVLGRYMETEIDQSRGIPGYTQDHSEKALHHTARQGLPTGSSCAPIVADFCLSRLAWPVAYDASLINFVDNFLLTASSEPMLEMLVERLHEAVGKLPGGHFKLRLVEKGHAEKGFGFLGHEMRNSYGKIRIRASARNLEAVLKTLSVLDAKFSSSVYGLGSKNMQSVLRDLAKMYVYARGWLDSFALSDNSLELHNFFMEEIAKNGKMVGLAMSQIESAVDASMCYRPSGYDFSF